MLQQLSKGEITYTVHKTLNVGDVQYPDVMMITPVTTPKQA